MRRHISALNKLNYFETARNSKHSLGCLLFLVIIVDNNVYDSPPEMRIVAEKEPPINDRRYVHAL